MSDFVYKLATELADECLDPVSPEHDATIALMWGGDKKRPFIQVELPVSGIGRVAKVLSRVRTKLTLASGVHDYVANGIIGGQMRYVNSNGTVPVQIQ